MTSRGLNNLLEGINVSQIITVSLDNCSNMTDQSIESLVLTIGTTHIKHMSIINYEYDFGDSLTKINKKMTELYLDMGGNRNRFSSIASLLKQINELNLQTFVMN